MHYSIIAGTPQVRANVQPLPSGAWQNQVVQALVLAFLLLVAACFTGIRRLILAVVDQLIKWIPRLVAAGCAGLLKKFGVRSNRNERHGHHRHHHHTHHKARSPEERNGQHEHKQPERLHTKLRNGLKRLTNLGKRAKTKRPTKSETAVPTEELDKTA